MVLPVILSFAGSFLINSGSSILGLFGGRGRGRIEDDELFSGRRDLRSRADNIRGKNDPFADTQPQSDDDDDVFNAQSVKSRSSVDRFTSQSAKPPASTRFNTQSGNLPPRASKGSGSSSPLPPPKANLSRRPTSDLGNKRNSVDDDFDSLNVPSLRDRRPNRRRRDSNDYDDEIMGGVFADEDGDDLI
jgi:hypothetical protein